MIRHSLSMLRVANRSSIIMKSTTKLFSEGRDPHNPRMIKVFVEVDE